MQGGTATEEQAEKQPVPGPDEPQDPPSPEPEVSVAGRQPDEPGGMLWAKKETLSEQEPWEDTVLPGLGMMVRVRYLPTPELAQLQFLPALLPFAELTAQLASNIQRSDDEEATDVDPAAWAAENYRYQAWVAHTAVMDPVADPRPRKCDHCTRQATDGAKSDSIKVVRHPPSLWTPQECEFLKTGDLGHIAGIALRAGEVQRLIPFSHLSTESGSPPPATTGE